MSSRRARFVLGFLLASSLVSGCSMGSAIPEPQPLGATPTSAGPQPAPARPATKLALAAHTCWTGELLGEDPQLALKLAGTFGITYFDAAYALQDRPAFRTRRSCSQDHGVEVYRLVRASALATPVTDYGALMRTQTLDFSQLSAEVSAACMDKALATAARQSDVPGASLQPAAPAGVHLGWSPATVEQWNRGQRVFACTLTQDDPGPLRYAALRSSSLPTQQRTCIASGSRIFVDCARAHDRERIAVLDVTGAATAGTFPGRGAVRRTARGSYLDVDAAFYRPLDRACTAYLRSVSTDRRLVGVAEIDVRSWPDARGVYAISCEADAPATEPSKVTRGSVYNRVGG